MTCCAPIMFIPIKYKGDLYIDGGYCGNFPFDIEHKYKKYIGLNIMCNDLQYNTLNNKHNNHKINSISDYLRLLYRIFGIQVRRENKRIININIYESGLDFKKQNNHKKKIINEGYNQTHNYFKSFPSKLRGSGCLKTIQILKMNELARKPCAFGSLDLRAK